LDHLLSKETPFEVSNLRFEMENGRWSKDEGHGRKVMEVVRVSVDRTK